MARRVFFISILVSLFSSFKDKLNANQEDLKALILLRIKRNKVNSFRKYKVQRHFFDFLIDALEPDDQTI
jgi:hypothetical protein